MDQVISHQFVSAEQQKETTRLGMWTFLASEVLFFGALFTGYTVYRIEFHDGFAEASGHLYRWIGIGNTAVLLVSSLTMALAVHAAVAGRRSLTAGLLGMTALLGAVFLAVKGVEYRLDYHDAIVPVLRFDAAKFEHPGQAAMHLVFYFIMTGLHAVHLLAAVAVAGVCAVRTGAGSLGLGEGTRLEALGLYWHFVDVVWVFLLPLLYFIK